MSCENSKARKPRKHKQLEKQEERSNAVAIACTPTKNTRRLQSEKDYSPVFLPCTQESKEHVDVMWDWNSPQSKLNLRKQRRLLQAGSPKVPIKKQTSNDQLDNFDNLKVQLQAFQEQINPVTDDQLELESHESTNNDSESFDNLFDDSIEDQLILVSQQIEAKYENDVPEPEQNLEIDERTVETIEPINIQLPPPIHSSSPRKFLTKSLSSNTLDSSSAQSPVRKVTEKSKFNFISKMHATRNESCTKDPKKDECFEVPSIQDVPSNNSPLKFKCKSLSFGDHCAGSSKKTEIIIDEKLKEEIERKRLQARARLKSKQMQETSDSDTSPIKRSPEEIETNRKQALAKLETKRQQELIERKRQEALKKRGQKNK